MSKNPSTKCITSIFTVFFEDPFWVGVLERNYNGINYMGKYIFGAEPTNIELLQFYINKFDTIKCIKISENNIEKHITGFKKSLNKAKKAQNNIGISTKSQSLFKKAFEEEIKIKKAEKREEKYKDKEERYKIKLQKKLKKKQGH